MSAALARGNVALALSVFKAMHRSALGRQQQQQQQICTWDIG